MSELQPIKPKSFWERPEGVTGGLFMAAIVLGVIALVVLADVLDVTQRRKRRA